MAGISSISGQLPQRRSVIQQSENISEKNSSIHHNGLSAFARLNKVRVNTTQPVARVLAHTNRYICNGFTGFCSYVEAITNPYKSTAAGNKGTDGDSAARVEHHIKLQQQRAQAIKWLGRLTLCLDLGTLASGIAGIAAPPAQIAALSFFLAALVTGRSAQSVSQLALEHLKPQLLDKPNAQHLFDAAVYMKNCGKKFIQTDQGLCTRTDLFLRAHATATAELQRLLTSKQELLQSGTEENHDRIKAIDENIAKVNRFLKDTENMLKVILSKKVHKRVMKIAFKMMPACLPQGASELAQVFGSAGKKIPFNHHSRVSVISASQQDKSAGFRETLKNLQNQETRPMTEKEKRSLITVVDLLQGNVYGSQTSRPYLDITLRNLEWRPKNNQKDWLHLLVAHKSHDYEQAAGRFNVENYEEQPFTLENQMKAEQAYLDKQAEHDSLKPSLARNSVAKLAHNGIAAAEIEKEYLTLTTGEVACRAFNSMRPSDRQKFADNRIEAMTPTGQGIIYACHGLMRKNRDLFGKMDNSFKPFCDAKDFAQALVVMTEVEKREAML